MKTILILSLGVMLYSSSSAQQPDLITRKEIKESFEFREMFSDADSTFMTFWYFLQDSSQNIEAIYYEGMKYFIVTIRQMRRYFPDWFFENRKYAMMASSGNIILKLLP